jgi:DNA-binding MarR family transcriptional regulator
MKPRLIDAIFLLNRECMFERNEICEKANLTQQEFIIIDMLNTNETVSCSTIANRILLSVSRTSRLIESLVQKGHLIREEDPDNRKYIKVYFTSKGKNTKKRIEELKDKCERKIVSKVESKDLGIIEKSVKILSKIIHR